MRMIIEPGTDKEGQPLAQTEDVRIHFFNRDETEKNIYLQGITLQVPLNCGVFAKAAMLKGFFEHFDKMGGAPVPRQRHPHHDEPQPSTPDGSQRGVQGGVGGLSVSHWP